MTLVVVHPPHCSERWYWTRWNIRAVLSGLPLSWVGRACPPGRWVCVRRCACGPSSTCPGPFAGGPLHLICAPRPRRGGPSSAQPRGASSGGGILGPPSGEVWSPTLSAASATGDGKILWVCPGKPAVLQGPRGLCWGFAALWPRGVGVGVGVSCFPRC